MVYVPKPIASLTIRVAGTVAYADGSKGSFAGMWDGKRMIIPNGAPEFVAAESCFADTAMILEIEDQLSDVTSNPSAGGVYFTYSLPGSTPAVRDLNFSLSGNVAHKDGSNTSYEATFQKGLSTGSFSTKNAMQDIVHDLAASNIMNTLLTEAAGFPVALV
jgi:hypothetical protein